LKSERWAVLISGRGSNLAALLELREEIDIRLVVSSSARALGLLRAKRAGVATALTPMTPATKPGAEPGVMKIDWVALHALLKAARVTHVFLAGFMKIVPASFVAKFPAGHLVNLHPSLLPLYPGLDSIERAFKDGTNIGVTVHEVIEQVDAGKIILQRRTLTAGESKLYSPAVSLEQAEFLVHVDEQRVIREAIRRWHPSK
jgi:phosphoribosylglycinamide formyltransferase-1